MFIGRDFPPFQDEAARLLGFDLGNLLGVGETVTAVTSRLRTIDGSDNFPGNHLPEAPQFSGTQVAQLVVFDDAAMALVGNVYALSFSVTTSAKQVLVPWSRFRVDEGFGVTGYAGGAAPAGAQSVILTAAPLYYVLPTLEGGYIGQDLPIATQGETIAYGFDFAPALSPDETITSAIINLALLDGTDASITDSPTAYNVTGGRSISGSAVSQLIAWPPAPDLSANAYGLYVTAVTSFNQSLAAWSRIVVGAIA